VAGGRVLSRATTVLIARCLVVCERSRRRRGDVQRNLTTPPRSHHADPVTRAAQTLTPASATSLKQPTRPVKLREAINAGSDHEHDAIDPTEIHAPFTQPQQPRTTRLPLRTQEQAGYTLEDIWSAASFTTSQNKPS
jgi:hypothetical protein